MQLPLCLAFNGFENNGSGKTAILLQLMFRINQTLSILLERINEILSFEFQREEPVHALILFAITKNIVDTKFSINMKKLAKGFWVKPQSAENF